MRQSILIAFLSTISLLNCMAQKQNDMESKIKATVVSIEQAAAKRDIEQLSKFLHEDYRVVANRFKGGTTATVISKEAYLGMIKDEKIGGTHYEIEFNDIKIFDHTAIVDLTFVSDATSDMHKFLVLIQDEVNKWKVVSDIPVVID